MVGRGLLADVWAQWSECVPQSVMICSGAYLEIKTKYYMQ